MGFLTAILSGYGGYGQGKQQAYQNALDKQRLQQSADAQASEQSYRQAELAEQAKNDQANTAIAQSRLTAEQRGAGIDPATGQPFPFVVPKALQQVSAQNRGQAASPEQYVEHYLGLAAQAAQQNRPDLAKQYTDLAQQYGLGAERAATAAYTSGAKTDVARSQVGLNDAKRKAELDLPQRARAIASGHDQASIQRAAMGAEAAWNRAELSASTREQVAQYQGTTRYAVAQLTGAYMLQGRSADEATRLAIADFNGGVRKYLQQTNPRNLLLDPNATDDSQSQFPAININLNGGQPGAPGGGLQPLPTLPPPPWVPQNPNAAQPPNNNAATKPPPAHSDTVPASIADGKKMLSAGKRPHEIRALIQQGVQAKKITPAQAQEIEKALDILPTGATGGGFDTSLLPVGGSEAPSPFG